MAMLSIYLLGAPRLDLDGKTVAFERNKALALLAYLAMENTAQARESLAALFWPDYDRERAYAYLRRTLWSIRETLGEGWLEAGREQVSLQRTPDLRLDVQYFREALEECNQHDHAPDQVCGRCIQSLEQAVAFYRGDFMSGFSLRDSAAFDEWQFFQSEKLKTELASALQRLAQAYSGQADANRAILAVRRWLALDLLNEEAHRLLMQIYAQDGQRNAALRQYQECQRILKAELGVEPQIETTRLYESIRDGNQINPGRSKAELQLIRPDFQRLQLPNPSTPFVGRVAELVDITALLLNSECRLLTLVGPGGIGKTRLSIQAAAKIVDRNPSIFADGVVFVPLAPVNSAQWLVSAIATALKVQFRSEQLPRDTPEPQQFQLIEYLRDRKILLVLDNFEHLMAGAHLLTEILADCPGVKLLATSRERLRLAQEWVFEVGGMSFPQDGSLEPLEAYPAVQLFIQHARRARVNFEASQADKASVAHICRLVEGVPLAIELAAAWVSLLSCSEIAAEIERNLDFLTANQRETPERHQSLRAVFENSWNLLSQQEQDVLMRLSVFRGSFRREAGAAVVEELRSLETGSSDPAAASTRGSRGPAPFLLLLSALVDKSLLRRVESDHEVRFAMHELIRQYAAEKLAQTADAAEQSRDRQAAYVAAWLVKMYAEMRSPRQIQALNQVELEIEDVRSAWRWMIERRNYPALLQCLNGLAHYYNIRNRYQEAEDDLRLALESFQQPLSSQAETVYVYLLAYYSSVLFNSENYALANQVYAQTLDLVSRLGEADQAQVYTLMAFGSGRLPQEQVEQNYRRSQQIFLEAGDRWAVALTMLVYVTYAQYTLANMELARRLCQDSRALFESLGDKVGMVFSLINHASLCYALGEYETVKQLCHESLGLCRALGDRWRTATSLLNLGQACVALGEYAQAREVYKESLELVRALGNRRVTARFLSCLGYVEYLEEDFRTAGGLFGEALELSRQMGDLREMGMVEMNLGNIALSGGDLEEARKRYQSAIDLLQDIPFARWEYAICLKRMGGLCYRTGEVTSAWENYRRALHISLELKRTPEVLDNLVGIAELLGYEGQAARAVELLALALAHEECARAVRERAQSLLSVYQAQLPAGVFNSAALNGREKLLEQAASAF